MKKQVAFYLEEATKRSLDQYKDAMGVSLQTLLATVIEEMLAEPEAIKLLAEYASSSQIASTQLLAPKENASTQMLADSDEGASTPASNLSVMNFIKKRS